MVKPDAAVRRWAKYAIIIVAVLIVLNLVSYLFYPSFMPWFEQRDAGEEVIKDTYDADRAVETYEEFRRLYNDIQAQRAQIENYHDELDRFYDTWGEDPDEWDDDASRQHRRIQKRITGAQNGLERLIGEYNAKSQQANTAVFKCHLPYKVDEQFGISGPPGSGDADEPVDTDPDGTPVDTDAPIPPAEECDGLPDEINQGT